MTFIVMQVYTSNDLSVGYLHFYQSRSHKSNQILQIAPLTNQIIRKKWISYSGALTIHPIIFFSNFKYKF